MEIPAAWCTGGRDLGEPRLHPSAPAIGYLAGSAGVAALWWHPLDGTPPNQLTSWPAPRPARGLGGGVWQWTTSGHGVVFVAAVDGQIWFQPRLGEPRRVTDHGQRSAASPVCTPDDRWVIYTLDDAEVWRSALDGSAHQRLDRGQADFVIDPCPLPDGTGARWIAWDVPNMPWDATRVQRVVFDGMAIDDDVPRAAIQQVRVLRDGRASWVRDDDGWLNVWFDDRPVLAEAAEHAGPLWGPGQRSYAVSADARTVAVCRNQAGFGSLVLADVERGTAVELGRGVHGQLSWVGRHVGAVRSGAVTPPQVVVYDTTDHSRRVIARGAVEGWDHAGLTEPEPIEVAGPAGPVPARLYRAERDDGRLLCLIHGGPTDQWPVAFQPTVAYWRSRGWHVLVPDHRGSTGHGRDFQQALRGQWGVADVDDVAAAIAHAVSAGWAMPSRTFAIGGSAGGFTALELAARRTPPIAGVVASFPVTDLADLAERSHRYEAHYHDTLVGPLPGSADVIRRRSPIDHPQRLAHCPLLILHGTADPVVPVEQSIRLAEAVRAAGGDVELHVYDGEGHGWRQPATHLDAYARIGAFLARHAR